MEEMITAESLEQLGYTYAPQRRKLIQMTKEYLIKQGHTEYADKKIKAVPKAALEAMQGMKIKKGS